MQGIEKQSRRIGSRCHLFLTVSQCSFRFSLQRFLLLLYHGNRTVSYTHLDVYKRQVEIVEIPTLKWFVGTQFHPEYGSTVLNPHPLFVAFVKAAIENEKATVNG